MKKPIEEMPDHSRVWVYQSSRAFEATEQSSIQDTLDSFITQWQAHGADLVAAATIVDDRFVVVMVDEKQNQATGCSIDASVALIRQLEQNFQVDFFDRMAIAWVKEGFVEVTPMHEFWAMRKAGLIHDNTVVYNNLVKDKAEFSTKWKVPFGESWHAEMW